MYAPESRKPTSDFDYNPEFRILDQFSLSFSHQSRAQTNNHPAPFHQNQHPCQNFCPFQSNSPGCGGARGSGIQAMTFIAPPHCRQNPVSILNTRLRRYTQLIEALRFVSSGSLRKYIVSAKLWKSEMDR